MLYTDFVFWWQVGYALGVLVVVIVAVLLLAILAVALSIERLARTARHVAGEIERSTRPIWSLAEANAIVEDIVRAVRRADAHTTAIADALGGGGR